jgi:hypothetical protein
MEQAQAVYSGAKEMAMDVKDMVMQPVATGKEIVTKVYSTTLDSIQMALMLIVAMQWVSVIKHLVIDKVMKDVDQNWGKLVAAIIVTTIAVVIGIVSKKVLKTGDVPRPITYAVIA